MCDLFGKVQAGQVFVLNDDRLVKVTYAERDAKGRPVVIYHGIDEVINVDYLADFMNQVTEWPS